MLWQGSAWVSALYKRCAGQHHSPATLPNITEKPQNWLTSKLHNLQKAPKPASHSSIIMCVLLSRELGGAPSSRPRTRKSKHRHYLVQQQALEPALPIGSCPLLWDFWKDLARGPGYLCGPGISPALLISADAFKRMKTHNGRSHPPHVRRPW